MRIPVKKSICVALSLCYFSTQVALGGIAESNIWTERKNAARLNNKSTSSQSQFAQLPASHSTSIFRQLPSVASALPHLPRSNDTLFSGKLKLSPPLRNLAEALPLAYATLQDVHNSGEDQVPPVVLLQDVHMNTEAQTNIARVLQELINRKSVGLVAVEGAFEKFDFKPFREFPDKKIAHEVTQIFLDKNVLAAPSYVGIRSAQEPPLFLGVDDRPHYEANVQAYLDSRPLMERLHKEIDQQEAKLSGEKRGAFSPDLLRFDADRCEYAKGQMGLGEYVSKLSAISSQFCHPERSEGSLGFISPKEIPRPLRRTRDDTVNNLRRSVETHHLVIEQFLEAYDLETRLDFNRVERERKSVLEKLSPTLNEREMTDLVAASFAYRMGKIGFGAYYQNLKRLCAEKGILLRHTPAFDDYIRYVLLSDGVQGGQLFSEIKALERKIFSSLARTEEEKNLIRESEHLDLTRKLIDFSLTPEEWQKYREADRGTKAQGPSTSLKDFESFYEQADLRSRKMVENLLKQIPNPKFEIPTQISQLNRRPGNLLAGAQVFPMKKTWIPARKHAGMTALKYSPLIEGNGRSTELFGLNSHEEPNSEEFRGPMVLVAGGFHTQEIARLLRDKKISYIVVSPKITRFNHEAGGPAEYLSVFAREKTPLDKLFEGKKLFLSDKATHLTHAPTALRWAAFAYSILTETVAKVSFKPSSRQSFGRDPGLPSGENLGPGQKHAGATNLSIFQLSLTRLSKVTFFFGSKKFRAELKGDKVLSIQDVTPGRLASFFILQGIVPLILFSLVLAGQIPLALLLLADLVVIRGSYHWWMKMKLKFAAARSEEFENPVQNINRSKSITILSRTVNVFVSILPIVTTILGSFIPTGSREIRTILGLSGFALGAGLVYVIRLYQHRASGQKGWPSFHDLSSDLLINASFLSFALRGILPDEIHPVEYGWFQTTFLSDYWTWIVGFHFFFGFVVMGISFGMARAWKRYQNRREGQADDGNPYYFNISPRSTRFWLLALPLLDVMMKFVGIHFPEMTAFHAGSASALISSIHYLLWIALYVSSFYIRIPLGGVLHVSGLMVNLTELLLWGGVFDPLFVLNVRPNLADLLGLVGFGVMIADVFHVFFSRDLELRNIFRHRQPQAFLRSLFMGLVLLTPVLGIISWSAKGPPLAPPGLSVVTEDYAFMLKPDSAGLENNPQDFKRYVEWVLRRQSFGDPEKSSINFSGLEGRELVTRFPHQTLSVLLELEKKFPPIKKHIPKPAGFVYSVQTFQDERYPLAIQHLKAVVEAYLDIQNLTDLDSVSPGKGLLVVSRPIIGDTLFLREFSRKQIEQRWIINPGARELDIDQGFTAETAHSLKNSVDPFWKRVVDEWMSRHPKEIQEYLDSLKPPQETSEPAYGLGQKAGVNFEPTRPASSNDATSPLFLNPDSSDESSDLSWPWLLAITGGAFLWAGWFVNALRRKSSAIRWVIERRAVGPHKALFRKLIDIKHPSVPKHRVNSQGEIEVQWIKGIRLDEAAKNLHSKPSQVFFEQLAEWVSQVAEACVLLESQGLQHGDLFENNVIIETETNLALLIDFFDPRWILWNNRTNSFEVRDQDANMIREVLKEPLVHWLLANQTQNLGINEQDPLFRDLWQFASARYDSVAEFNRALQNVRKKIKDGSGRGTPRRDLSAGVVFMPMVETLVFQVMINSILGPWWTAGLFAAAHVITRWVKRALAEGFNRETLAGMTALKFPKTVFQMALLFILSVDFTIPFQYFDPVTAFFISAAIHSAYNAFVLFVRSLGRRLESSLIQTLGDWLPLASLGGEARSAKPKNQTQTKSPAYIPRVHSVSTLLEDEKPKLEENKSSVSQSVLGFISRNFSDPDIHALHHEMMVRSSTYRDNFPNTERSAEKIEANTIRQYWDELETAKLLLEESFQTGIPLQAQLQDEILGGYKIIRQINQGGFGILYEAKSLADPNGPSVAIKVPSIRTIDPLSGRPIPTPLTHLIVAIAALRQEHKNLEQARKRTGVAPRPIGLGRDRNTGTSFLVMEFIEGPNLAERKIPLTLQEAIRLGEAVLELHQAGLVHGDLKPENILISFEGRVRLVDLGAAVSSSHTPQKQFGDYFFSLIHVDSGRITGEFSTTASDVFSLAMVISHLLPKDIEVRKDVRSILVRATNENVGERSLLTKLLDDLRSVDLASQVPKVEGRGSLFSQLTKSIQFKDTPLDPMQVTQPDTWRGFKASLRDGAIGRDLTFHLSPNPINPRNSSVASGLGQIAPAIIFVSWAQGHAWITFAVFLMVLAIVVIVRFILSTQSDSGPEVKAFTMNDYNRDIFPILNKAFEELPENVKTVMLKTGVTQDWIQVMKREKENLNPLSWAMTETVKAFPDPNAWPTLLQLCRQADKYGAGLIGNTLPTLAGSLKTVADIRRIGLGLILIADRHETEGFKDAVFSYMAFRFDEFFGERLMDHWDEIMELSELYGPETHTLFQDGLNFPYREIGQNRFYDRWPLYRKIALQAKGQALGLLQQTIPKLETKNPAILDKIVDDLIRIANGMPAGETYVLRWGIPAALDVFNYDPNYWPAILGPALRGNERSYELLDKGYVALKPLLATPDLAEKYGTDLVGAFLSNPELQSSERSHFCEKVLPSLIDNWGEDFPMYWPSIIKVLGDAKNSHGIVEALSVIHEMKTVIHNRSDFEKYARDLARLSNASGRHFHGLPAELKSFKRAMPNEWQTRWDDVVAMAVRSEGNIHEFFMAGISNAQKALGDRWSDEEYWQTLKRVSESAGEWGAHILSYGIPFLIQHNLVSSPTDLERYAIDMAKMAGAMEGNGSQLFYTVLNAMADLSAGNLVTHWPDYMKICLANGDKAHELIRDGFQTVKNNIADDLFDQFWTPLVKFSLEAPKAAQLTMRISFRLLLTKSTTKEEFSSYVDDFIALGKSVNKAFFYSGGLPDWQHSAGRHLHELWPGIRDLSLACGSLAHEVLNNKNKFLSNIRNGRETPGIASETDRVRLASDYLTSLAHIVRSIRKSDLAEFEQTTVINYLLKSKRNPYRLRAIYDIYFNPNETMKIQDPTSPVEACHRMYIDRLNLKHKKKQPYAFYDAMPDEFLRAHQQHPRRLPITLLPAFIDLFLKEDMTLLADYDFEDNKKVPTAELFFKLLTSANRLQGWEGLKLRVRQKMDLLQVFKDKEAVGKYVRLGLIFLEKKYGLATLKGKDLSKETLINNIPDGPAYEITRFLIDWLELSFELLEIERAAEEIGNQNIPVYELRTRVLTRVDQFIAATSEQREKSFAAYQSEVKKFRKAFRVLKLNLLAGFLKNHARESHQDFEVGVRHLRLYEEISGRNQDGKTEFDNLYELAVSNKNDPDAIDSLYRVAVAQAKGQYQAYRYESADYLDALNRWEKARLEKGQKPEEVKLERQRSQKAWEENQYYSATDPNTGKEVSMAFTDDFTTTLNMGNPVNFGSCQATYKPTYNRGLTGTLSNGGNKLEVLFSEGKFIGRRIVRLKATDEGELIVFREPLYFDGQLGFPIESVKENLDQIHALVTSRLGLRHDQIDDEPYESASVTWPAVRGNAAWDYSDTYGKQFSDQPAGLVYVNEKTDFSVSLELRLVSAQKATVPQNWIQINELEFAQRNFGKSRLGIDVSRVSVKEDDNSKSVILPIRLALISGNVKKSASLLPINNPFYLIVIAPIWETLAFHNGAESWAAQGLSWLLGIDYSGNTMALVLIGSVLFAFAHTIVMWIVRAHHSGRAALSYGRKNNLSLSQTFFIFLQLAYRLNHNHFKRDIHHLLVRSILGFCLTVLPSPTVLHGAYNFLVFSFFGKKLPIGAIGSTKGNGSKETDNPEQRVLQAAIDKMNEEVPSIYNSINQQLDQTTKNQVTLQSSINDQLKKLFEEVAALGVGIQEFNALSQALQQGTFSPTLVMNTLSQVFYRHGLYLSFDYYSTARISNVPHIGIWEIIKTEVDERNGTVVIELGKNRVPTYFMSEEMEDAACAFTTDKVIYDGKIPIVLNTLTMIGELKDYHDIMTQLWNDGGLMDRAGVNDPGLGDVTGEINKTLQNLLLRQWGNQTVKWKEFLESEYPKYKATAIAHEIGHIQNGFQPDERIPYLIEFAATPYKWLKLYQVIKNKFRPRRFESTFHKKAINYILHDFLTGIFSKPAGSIADISEKLHQDAADIDENGDFTTGRLEAAALLPKDLLVTAASATIQRLKAPLAARMVTIAADNMKAQRDTIASLRDIQTLILEGEALSPMGLDQKIASHVPSHPIADTLINDLAQELSDRVASRRLSEAEAQEIAALLSAVLCLSSSNRGGLQLVSVENLSSKANKPNVFVKWMPRNAEVIQIKIQQEASRSKSLSKGDRTILMVDGSVAKLEDLKKQFPSVEILDSRSYSSVTGLLETIHKRETEGNKWTNYFHQFILRPEAMPPGNFFKVDDDKLRAAFEVFLLLNDTEALLIPGNLLNNFATMRHRLIQA
ncbi:MAG: hypothetical protein KCHDKBKB_02925 [Elusimicrobia bacterium]|nr:hypothetical protein [Elusimicrobiota bacterium]